jgi:hypothetical protein
MNNNDDDPVEQNDKLIPKDVKEDNTFVCDKDCDRCTLTMKQQCGQEPLSSSLSMIIAETKYYRTTNQKLVDARQKNGRFEPAFGKFLDPANRKKEEEYIAKMIERDKKSR